MVEVWLLKPGWPACAAGDCRAVLCRAGKALQLTEDHSAASPSERARVEATGARVDWRVNSWRVGTAGLQVTRCAASPCSYNHSYMHHRSAEWRCKH